MKIERISINNYRNLNGVSVHFNLESNYIVGENNIGKSNILDLIGTIDNAWSFAESDYVDPSSPIVIDFTLNLNESESGAFGENSDPADASFINIKVMQNIEDAHPQVIDGNTGESLQPGNLRKLNFIKYDTNTNPDIEQVNSYLKRIRAFDPSGVNAAMAPDSTDLISRLLYLMDGNMPIRNAGNGVEFISMAALNVFGKILELYRRKSTPFEECTFISKEGRKFLPLIIAIDEPEVHLHPYMQRALLNYYKRILKNEDSSFLALLKQSFGIDGLDGQLIIVTHSTDALVDDHRNIIRFYKKADGKTSAISGMDINIATSIEKHLLMHFQDVKEAFYAKCVLIVEGETEYGCIRGFCRSLNMSLDDYGICFVNAQGEGSILKLKQLFDHFEIPSILIFDSDVKAGKPLHAYEFFTKEVCFEMDIVDKLIQMNRFDILRAIPLELNGYADKRVLDEDFVKKPFRKINYDISSYIPKSLENLDDMQMDEYRAVYFAWYYSKKGILIGRIIGEMVPDNCIPDCYIDAISKAKEVTLQY
jgi:putative ATP-dependent endonuclease of OLD family